MHSISSVAILVLATTLALVQGQIMNPCPWEPARRGIAARTNSTAGRIESMQFLHLANIPFHETPEPNKLDKRIGKPLEPCVTGHDVHCYCYPPRPLYTACEPITSGYSKGTIPNTCENYKAYVKCWNDVQPYCTPESLFG